MSNSLTLIMFFQSFDMESAMCNKPTWSELQFERKNIPFCNLPLYIAVTFEPTTVKTLLGLRCPTENNVWT